MQGLWVARWGRPAGLRCSFTPNSRGQHFSLPIPHVAPGLADRGTRPTETRGAHLYKADQCWRRLRPVLPPPEPRSPLPSRPTHSSALLETQGHIGEGPALMGTMPARLSDT